MSHLRIVTASTAGFLFALAAASYVIGLVSRASLDCHNPLPVAAAIAALPLVIFAVTAGLPIYLMTRRARFGAVLVAGAVGIAIALVLCMWLLSGYAADLSLNGIGACVDGPPPYWPSWAR